MRKRAAFTGVVVVLIAALCGARAATRADPALTQALRAEPALRACACIVSAGWIGESYARIIVDAARWNALPRARRTRFGKRALDVTKTFYLRVWAATDFYDEVFIVDRRGRLLFHYQP